MQDFQLKTRLEEIMGSDMFKRQSEQEGGGRKKKMKVDTSGREEMDMDIESGKLHLDNSFPFDDLLWNWKVVVFLKMLSL